MDQPMVPVSIDDTFVFSCSKDVACFNACCRDLNQFLTPYDILRLKKALGLHSSEFLSKFCMMHEGPESGLPIVSLCGDSENEYECPFVTDAGCSVYSDRPASCRIYPVARALKRSRETGEVSEHFAMIKESHCQGFSKGKEQTVRQWLEGQGVEEYNLMNDLMMEIISLKNQIIPGPLDEQSNALFCRSLYDLDSFRSEVMDDDFAGKDDLSQDLLQRIAEDDVELLRFGMDWVKFKLFGVTFNK